MDASSSAGGCRQTLRLPTGCSQSPVDPHPDFKPNHGKLSKGPTRHESTTTSKRSGNIIYWWPSNLQDHEWWANPTKKCGTPTHQPSPVARLMQGQPVGKEFTRPFDDGKQPNSRHLGGYDGGRPSDDRGEFLSAAKMQSRHPNDIFATSLHEGSSWVFSDPKRPMPWTQLAGWRYEGHVVAKHILNA